MLMQEHDYSLDNFLLMVIATKNHPYPRKQQDKLLAQIIHDKEQHMESNHERGPTNQSNKKISSNFRMNQSNGNLLFSNSACKNRNIS